MDQQRMTARAAVDAGAEIARSAWRRLWAVQLAAAAGPALMFVGVRAPLSPALSSGLFDLGMAATLLSWASLWTGLLRFAIGGAPARRIRYGGLQFGTTEAHMLVLGGCFWVAVVFSILPLIACSAVIFIVFRPLGLVTLGPMGQFQVSFLIAAAAWLAGLGVLGWATARLVFASTATVSRRRLVLAESWTMTAGRAATIAGAWILSQAPTLLAFALLALVDSMELEDSLGVRSRWPLADALVAGGVLGLVLGFIAAPLTAGVLGALYRDHRAWRAATAAPLGRRFRPAAPAPVSPFASGAFVSLKR